MDLRTHVWGASITAVILGVGAVVALAWLRPLPSGAQAAQARIESTWNAYQQGELSAQEAAHALAKFAQIQPGFGETLSNDADPIPYDAVHQQAIERLNRIEHRVAFDLLCKLALVDERHVNLYAVEALRRRGDKAALPTLLAVLEHDDRRQRRLDDHFARVTQETLRALREMAHGDTLARLRTFVHADRRMFDQDIRRTITLMVQDLTAPVEAGGQDQQTATLDDLFNPNPDRLGLPSAAGNGAFGQVVRDQTPLLAPEDD